MLDGIDKRIVNELQGGFPLTERPYADVAASLGIAEQEAIERIKRLLEQGVLSCFGPMYDAEALGGAFCLCAMSVPGNDVDRIAALVNAHPEVAHNYLREHRINIWFVLATETVSRIDEIMRIIEAETGLPVLAFPKLEEFFVGLKVHA